MTQNLLGLLVVPVMKDPTEVIELGVCDGLSISYLERLDGKRKRKNACRLTLNPLGREEIMPHSLNTRCRQSMSKCARKILENHTARHFGEFFLELGAVVPNITTDIDEDRLMGIPAKRLPFERVQIQPAASVLLLEAHVLEEGAIIHRVLGEPGVHVQVSVVCQLEDRGFAVRDVFVVRAVKESWQFLEERAAVLETVKKEGWHQYIIFQVQETR